MPFTLLFLLPFVSTAGEKSDVFACFAPLRCEFNLYKKESEPNAMNTSSSREQQSSVLKGNAFLQRPHLLKFLISLLLIVLTLATFWQVRDNGFINFDDDVYVVENPHVNRDSASRAFSGHSRPPTPGTGIPSRGSPTCWTSRSMVYIPEGII